MSSSSAIRIEVLAAPPVLRFIASEGQLRPRIVMEHWRGHLQAHPSDYDGEILCLSEAYDSGYDSTVQPTTYSHYVARRHGVRVEPCRSIAVNLLAVGRSKYLLGRVRGVGEHAGKIKMIGGAAEPRDVVDDMWRPATTLTRELREEVGPTTEAIRRIAASRWLSITDADGSFVIFVAIAALEPGDVVFARESVAPDLEKIEPVWLSSQELADIDPASCPRYLPSFIRFVLAHSEGDRGVVG